MPDHDIMIDSHKTVNHSLKQGETTYKYNEKTTTNYQCVHNVINLAFF